jgi:WD40 repeat protein
MNLSNENILKQILVSLKLYTTSFAMGTVNKTIHQILINIFGTCYRYKLIGTTKTILADHNDTVMSLALLSDTTIVSASNDKTLRVWNTTNYQFIKIIKDEGTIKSVISLPNNYFASCTWDGTINIWDNNYKLIKTIQVDLYTCFWSLLLLPNNNIAFSAKQGSEYYILILDFNDGYNNTGITFTEHMDYVTAMVNLSGNRFASGSEDGVIQIWEVLANSCKAVKTLKYEELLENSFGELEYAENKYLIECLLFIARDNVLLVGTSDNYIKVLEMNENYRCVKEIEAHEKGVRSLLELREKDILPQVLWILKLKSGTCVVICVLMFWKVIGTKLLLYCA